MKKVEFRNMDVANQNLLDDNFLNFTVGMIPPFYDYYNNADGDAPTDEPAPDEENQNEDNTDYENEDKEAGGVDPADLPKFRTLVKNKKLELKAQYGKAHFHFGACGLKPLPPNIAHPNVICLWNCSKHADKACCKENDIRARKRDEQRTKIANWEKCRSENKIFVSGWRKKWREFKKQGGLAQLKMQSKGLSPITPPPSAPQPSTTPSPLVPFAMRTNVKKTGTSDSTDDTLGTTDSTSNKSASKKATTNTDKILGIPKIGFYIGVGAIVLVGGIFLIRRLTK